MEAPALHRRCPAFLTALCLALGIICADQYDLAVWWWIGVAAISWGVAFCVHWRAGPAVWISFALWVTIVMAGGLRYQLHTRLLPEDHIAHGAAYGVRGVLTGRLAAVPDHLPDGRRRVRVRLESLLPEPAQPETRSLSGQPSPDGPRDGRDSPGHPDTADRLVPLSGDLLLTVGEQVTDFAAGPGDRVRLRCRIIEPQPARNPGSFDYRRFLLLRHGIHATATLYRDADLLAIDPGGEGWRLQDLVNPLRDSIRGSLTAHLSGPPAALLVGMLLGDKYSIPGQVAARFRSTGLAHALVISGLHVGLVALFLLTALRVLRLPDPVACCVTVVLLGLYAVVTQLQAPVVRASVMAAIVLIGRAVEHRGSVLNSLGLAAIVLMIAQPATVLTLSFQLSFAATLAIITLYPPLLAMLPASWREGTSRWGKLVGMPAAVSLAAQLGTAPLILHHFGQMAPISLLANLLVVPLLGLAVAQGLLLVLVTPILPLLAPVISGGCWLSMTALLHLVELFAIVPAIAVAQPSTTVTILVTGLIWLLTCAIYVPALRRFCCWALLLSANVWVWQRVTEAGDLQIVFLDVGQGDAAYVRLPDGRSMIVDAGMRSRRIDMGERVIVPWLRRQGVDRVDIVVASHPHADHIGGLVHLLEQIRVDHFIDAGQAYDSWTARRLHRLIEEKQIRYHAVQAGDSLANLGGAGALILHPTPAFVENGESLAGLNNGSVAMRLDYAGCRVLFTGDIEFETERSLLAWASRLQADVLKVPHHGSATSSGRYFVDAVNPALAVISVGAHNKFRHPSPRVTQRLSSVATVLRTDRDGAILLRVDEAGRVDVETQLTAVPSHTTWDRFRPSR